MKMDFLKSHPYTHVIKKIILKVIKNWKFLFVFFISLIFINLFFLRWNLNDTNLTPTSHPILKAYRVQGQAFYQKSDFKKWYILSGEEQISSGVHIQTYSESRMILLFLNNPSRIEVAENSLLSISETDKEVILDFKKGELFINAQKSFSDKKIILKIGNKFFALESTDVFVRGKASSHFEIQVDYGKLVMQHDEKQSVFTKGQEIVFRNPREYAVQESAVQFSNPFNFDRYFVEASDSMDVRFAWTAPQKSDYAQIYIGTDADNLKAVFEKPIALRKSELIVPLGKGVFYWKLALLENPKQSPIFVSKLQKFFIEPLIPIQPTFPDINAEFPLAVPPSSTKTTEVQFQWTNPSQLEKIFIEIALDKNFSKVVAHESIPSKNYYFATFNTAGDYFWRVNGFPFKSSELVTGVSRKIRIADKSTQPLIQFVFPSANTTLTQNMIQSSDVIFEWKTNLHLTKYRVLIQGPQEKSSSGGMKKYEYATTDTTLKITHLEPGTYKWKVESKEGVSSLESTFKVIKSKTLDLLTGSDTRSLVWNKGPQETEAYRIDVLRVGSENSMNELFSNRKSSKQSLNSKKEKLDLKSFSKGVYLFKVYAIDKKNKIVADSNVRFVKINP